MMMVLTDKSGMWGKITILTLLAGLVFYVALVWNPLAGIVLFAPLLLLAYFFDTTRLWWITIGLVPLSINTEIFTQGQLGLHLPTEPILAGFLILSIPYFLLNSIDKRYLNHPIIWLIILYLGWMLVTVITSSNPAVSLKSFIVQIWFIIPICFLSNTLFRQPQNRIKFINIYTAGFTVVLMYTFFRLWSHGFPERESQWLMQPFFKDHTILGAILGLIMPYFYLRCFDRTIHQSQRMMWIGLSFLATIVLIFTYSRAAILSLGVAAGLYVLLRLKIPFKYLIMAGIMGACFIWWNQDLLIEKLSSNQAESSGEVMENIESISNISTDASNLERINRWNSALAMWQEKPLIGWGPGTYQFEYAPFQKSADLTIISTNVGDVGNAHSEFLGALAESGWPAMILLIILVLTTIGIGYSTAIAIEGKDRLVLTAALLGYTAYFTHGVLNNFLTSDKAAILIWGFTAIIIYYHLDFQRAKNQITYVK